ncbi:hypothetical protein GWK47_046318 [Chionoecetes opilio]|uniref:Uncharacterized protein n=1 Tax=Chionoecetes opilio TaxID=41210 RepID=A0A8J5CUW3_CHIOP|nr:hypothetical protein GWK47_046318 [Chionoecetes opilio]
MTKLTFICHFSLPARTCTTTVTFNCHFTLPARTWPSGRENVPILETRAHKGVRWCWLARESGTSTASPTGKKPFSCVAWRFSEAVVTQPGWHSLKPVPCGIPQAPRGSRGVPVSREDSPARTGLVSRGGLQHPPVAGPSTLDAASLLVCRLHMTIQERAAYSKKGPYLAL